MAMTLPFIIPEAPSRLQSTSPPARTLPCGCPQLQGSPGKARVQGTEAWECLQSEWESSAYRTRPHSRTKALACLLIPNPGYFHLTGPSRQNLCAGVVVGTVTVSRDWAVKMLDSEISCPGLIASLLSHQSLEWQPGHSQTLAASVPTFKAWLVHTSYWQSLASVLKGAAPHLLRPKAQLGLPASRGLFRHVVIAESWEVGQGGTQARRTGSQADGLLKRKRGQHLVFKACF